MYGCNFERGGWDGGDWWMVKSARWEHEGEWVQEGDHIWNRVPEGGEEELVEDAALAGETYTSMVYGEGVKGAFEVGAGMSFDYRMAPLIVLAEEPEYNEKNKREYRRHIEVVVYDEGVNVWHHQFIEGKQSWVLAAYWRFGLQAKTRYDLKVARRGNTINVRLGEKAFGCYIADLPEVLFAGITGCEGINRFYNFEINDA